MEYLLLSVFMATSYDTSCCLHPGDNSLQDLTGHNFESAFVKKSVNGEATFFPVEFELNSTT